MEKDRFKEEYDRSLMNVVWLFTKNIESALQEDNPLKVMQYVTAFDIYSETIASYDKKQQKGNK